MDGEDEEGEIANNREDEVEEDVEKWLEESTMDVQRFWWWAFTLSVKITPHFHTWYRISTDFNLEFTLIAEHRDQANLLSPETRLHWFDDFEFTRPIVLLHAEESA